MNRFEQAVHDCMKPTAKLLETTTKPLHRAILLNFWRHVHLEGAGEYDRILAPDMIVDHPVYRVTWGANPAVIEGKDGVRAFYNSVGEAVLWHSDDRLAVADWGVCDEITFHQLAADLKAIGYGRSGRALPRREPAGVHLAVRRSRPAGGRAPLRGQDQSAHRGSGSIGSHYAGACARDSPRATGQARGAARTQLLGAPVERALSLALTGPTLAREWRQLAKER